MRSGQVSIQLRPFEGGSFTLWSAHGSVPTAIPPAQLRRLLSGLAFWSGWRVRLALSVDAETAGWCECWSEALGAVPARHLEVCFRQRGTR
jgi:hypothetical protein